MLGQHKKHVMSLLVPRFTGVSVADIVEPVAATAAEFNRDGVFFEDTVEVAPFFFFAF